MKLPAVLAGLLAGVLGLLGCVEDTWSNRVQEPEHVSDPPEHLLRRPADFRMIDVSVRKEFFLYMYEDESIREVVITVINKALPQLQQHQRMATAEEVDYAVALFTNEWKSRGEEQKLRYFNERYGEEQRRNATLIDSQIVYKRAEKEDLEQQIEALDADLKSRKETSTFAAGDEKFNLADQESVQRELSKRRRRLAIAEAELAILEYKRELRDAQFARLGLVFADDSIPVADLLANYSAPERLADEVRLHVAPSSWLRPQAWIRVSGGTLQVHQTRDVLLQIRDYLDRMRADFSLRPAKEKASK
jgi:hypothetical protein